jgi:L-rhamnose isomerase
MDVPAGESWMEDIQRYDAEVTRKRDLR